MRQSILVLTWLVLSVCAFAQTINKAEYFIDGPDPGPGLATAIPGFVVSNHDTVAFNASIPALNLASQPLSTGFHILVTRFRNNQNVWSMNEARTFYVTTPGSLTKSSEIESAEYFIDGPDPGVGSATAIPGFTKAIGDTVPFSSLIAALNLSSQPLVTGFHIMVTRFRDANGLWSMNEARTFYVATPTSLSKSTELESAEYFIDGPDPGVGNATSIPGFTAAAGDTVPFNTVIAALNLASSPLATGFHTMVMRFRDSNGLWGMNEARSFYVGPPAAKPVATQVVAAEYFFALSDPGVGKATPMTGFTPGDSMNVSKLVSIPPFLISGSTVDYTMRVKDNNGEWSMNYTQSFHICDSAAIAGFKYTQSFLTLSFQDTSLDGYSYLWIFGDNTTSTLRNPVHTYSSGGTFNITEIVFNPCGNDTVTKRINLACYQPSLSAAAFTATSNNFLQVAMALTNGAVAGYTYSWKFGDGSTYTADSISQDQPSHTYNVSNPTTYTITLTVSNGCGSVASTETVRVICGPPVAQFQAFLNGQTVTLVNQSENAFGILWHFGDGTISNLQSPLPHAYSSSGQYVIWLTVSNACGIDSTSDTINIMCHPPTSAFTYNPDGLQADFQNNSSGATSYLWYYGDGSKVGTITAPNHNYTTSGTYDVCLVAINGCGRDSVCDSVTVCEPPSAGFIPTDSALTTTFVNGSSNGVSYYWTFGDGYASNLISPAHTYASAGNYNVCLYVTNTCGTAHICKNVSTSCTAFAAPQICMVTVDSLSNNNIIYWDKTPFAPKAGGKLPVDSFIIYREESTNVYDQIGVVAYKDSSYFIDTVRSKYGPLPNGNPNTAYYRYELQFKDSCGGYSSLSNWHQELYVTNSASTSGPPTTTFYWTPGYLIEGTSVPTTPVTNYLMMVDSLGTNHWKQYGSSVTGNTFDYSILNSILESYPKAAKWRVWAQFSYSCTGDGPQLRTDAAKVANVSRSNVKNNDVIIFSGIKQIQSSSGKFSVYPNPARDQVVVEWDTQFAADQPYIAVLNYLGMEIMRYTPVSNQMKLNINTTDLPTGVYLIELVGSSNRAVQKVVIEK